MKRGWRLLGLTIIVMLLLSGCWNRRELNELAIQLGLAIEKIDGQYKITVQVVEPTSVAAKKQSGGAPVVLYQATAPTMLQAYRKMTQSSPRKMYAAHIRVVVLGEELAREGIASVLDLFSRDAELRTDYYMMIARGTEAGNILKVLTPMEKIPSNEIYYSLETSSKSWAPTTTFTLDKLINQLVGEGINPVLAGIELRGNPDIGGTKQNIEQIPSAASLYFSGLAAFKKDKLVGWLNEEESKGYNYIMNNVTSTIGRIGCPDGGFMTVEVIRTRSHIKAIAQNGNPEIEVALRVEGNVSELECNLNIEDPDTIKKLQAKGEQMLNGIMARAVGTMQKKYKSDIFGFGQEIYRTHPKLWKKLKADWPDHFARLKVNYRAELQISKVGSKGNSLLGDMEE